MTPRTSIHPVSGSHESPSQEATKHAEYVIDLARKLADGRRPGILATVDENGMPHLRWMATLSLRDFPILYTITSPQSRKVQHIINNPNVSWMFSNEEMNIIVNIRGKARIATDVGKMQHVWKLLEDKSKAYFLSIAIDGPGFAVIETEIEDIDCTVPKYDIRFQAHHVDLGSPSIAPGE
ncbi:MAG: pyridoxamine 5'-phosphate oxidase family protein [Methylacidiphilales bacterium]|nr:pyridoxamine 5'-phosphate oxidase family protein [Candidatus Methylacidiphilales bacterium]